MPQFTPGTPKPPKSGRRKGQVSKQTLLLRAGVKSAIEICRQGGTDPITIMMEAARLLNTIGAALTPRTPQNASQEDIIAAIRAVPRPDLEFMRKFLVDAANIAQKAAEFGYAKLQRIDYVGDTPQGPHRIENTFEFHLNIDAQPGRPVHGNDNESGAVIDVDGAELAEQD